jgi:threonine/homoserine/homoserine lactone efflux protein
VNLEFITFVLASLTIIVMPGPNVLVIVGTSLARGVKSGLQTVAGTSVAMLFQLLVAALGTGLLVNSLARGLLWLKWLGVGYLVYLGIGKLLAKPAETVESVSAAMTFGRGFWISLTNPKTILFFAAFLPQFTDPGADYLPQIAFLSALFWILAMSLDSIYALLAGHLGERYTQLAQSRSLGRVSGLTYLGAGALLASARQA